MIGWGFNPHPNVKVNDREIKIVKEKFGKIPVVTTIHPLQMVEFVPHAEHDTKVDIIVTPEKIYRIE